MVSPDANRQQLLSMFELLRSALANFVAPRDAQSSRGHNPPDLRPCLGQFGGRLGNLSFWEPNGPALQLFKTVAPLVKRLLEHSLEDIQQDGSKCTTLAFTLWMVGSSAENARPTIVLSSWDRRQREMAKQLLLSSPLVKQHPELRVRTREKMPAVFRADQTTISEDVDGSHESKIYLVDGKSGPCGALLTVDDDRPTTLSGAITLHGSYFGMIAQHSCYGGLMEACDDYSDSGEFDTEDEADEITRRDVRSDEDRVIKASAPNDPELSYLSGTLGLWSSENAFENAVDTAQDQSSSSEPVRMPVIPASRGVKQQIACISMDRKLGALDYAIFPLVDPMLCRPNGLTIDHSVSGTPKEVLVKKPVREPSYRWIIAVTGSTGCVKGFMTPGPTFLKMPGCDHFIETWHVVLERPTMQGDSGSWIVDAVTRELCGHMIAGCPSSKSAYIIPAVKVFEDIEKRYGAEPVLPLEAAGSDSDNRWHKLMRYTLAWLI